MVEEAEHSVTDELRVARAHSAERFTNSSLSEEMMGNYLHTNPFHPSLFGLRS